MFSCYTVCGTHQQSDGVQNDLVPVVYDAVCVILYQILRAVTCLELLSDMDSITGFIRKKYRLIYADKKISEGKSQQLLVSLHVKVMNIKKILHKITYFSASPLS